MTTATKFSGAAALLAVLSGASGDAAAQEHCKAFDEVLDRQAKALSYATYSGVLDDSAYRRQNRLTEAQIAWQTIQANLTLMAGAKCPLPKRPIVAETYRSAAFECSMELESPASRNRPAGQVLPACDRSKWEPAR